MDVVLRATKTMEQLCGAQSGVPDATWRMTAHCLRVPCDGHLLLFHTMTGCLLRLNATEAASIDTDAALRRELAARWFLVPPGFDERKHVRDVREVLRLLKGAKRHVTSFTVLPTTACNARCAYCFEQGVQPKTMDDAVALRVGAYIAEACGGKPVDLRWFGGEPLCNTHAIRIICAELRQRGITYDSILTSNGFFLTPDVAREAKRDWHITSVQITLDGTKAVYERVKAYVGAQDGAYERVLDNIEGALKAGIRVYIRLNMDRNNADDLSVLLDQLVSRFGNYPACKVLVVPLRPFTVPISAFATDAERERAARNLRGKAAEYGFLERPELIRKMPINRCKADNDGCEVILPDDHIAKCEHCLNGPYIGHIDSPARDAAQIAAWKTEVPEFLACETCPLYPHCIRTANCAWIQDGCDALSLKFRIEDQMEAVKRSYHNWLTKNGI